MNDRKDRKEPKTLTKTLCKEVVSKLGQICKLSNQSVDSITEDLLTNDSFIEASSDTLDTIITHTPRITFAIACSCFWIYCPKSIFDVNSNTGGRL